MALRLRQDSSRDLLEELEEGWGPPPPPRAALQAATAEAPTDDVPDLASLDEGWLDDLFPEDDDDDDDELEPELPDERLDPEAFALAKRAREERAARKKEKKRARAEAKRARQKARVAAMRQKQKTKKARASSPAFRHTPAPPRKDVRNDKGHPKYAETDAEAHAEHVRELPDAKAPTSKAAPKPSRAPRLAPNTLASVKLLAIVLATLLALAAAVAAILK